MNKKQERFTLEELTDKLEFRLVGEASGKNRCCFHNDYLGKGYVVEIKGNYLYKVNEYEIPVRYDIR